jgi:hypothetical protein
MNPHLDAFIAMAALRDSNLTQLGVMALAAVLTWYATGLLPWDRIQRLARFGYLAGGVIVYLWTVLVQVTSV